MKYFRAENRIRIEPDDTVSQLAQVTHSTLDEWIIFLEALVNEELEQWKNDKGDKNYRPRLQRMLRRFFRRLPRLQDTDTRGNALQGLQSA